MLQLDLLSFQDKIQWRNTETGREIFSPVRKSWLHFNKEEFVRQILIQYLLQAGFSTALMSEEKEISVFNLSRRYDLVIYSHTGKPWMLIECKEPGVAIDQKAFDQIARYNLKLRVPYLLVTNGRNSYCCAMNYEKESYTFLDELPQAE